MPCPEPLWINRVAKSFVGVGPGLLFSGGVFAVVFAYATRFLIIAVSHVEDGMEKIPSNYDHVARTLGRSEAFIFRSIHLPVVIYEHRVARIPEGITQ